MMPKSVWSLFLVAVALVAGWGTIALSQGSGSSRVDPSRTTRPQTPEEFYCSFWSHMVKQNAAYNTWKVIAREKADVAVENPHSSISRTYANHSSVSVVLNAIATRYDGLP